MQTKWLLFLLLTLSLAANAQITMNVQLPNGTLVQKEQLWNIILVNNSDEEAEIDILLDLKEIATGQSVLSAGTRSFTLQKGVKALSSQDLQPIQYNYSFLNPGSRYLPLGSYNACYIINKKTAKGDGIITEECLEVTVNPLAPPLLNYPEDKAVLQTATPTLNWLPPAPAEMFYDLSYELKIMEVLQKQIPEEAILYNQPVYFRTNVKPTFEIYPSGYAKLEQGKTYAWQVVAKNSAGFFIPTEVWSFTIAKDSIQEVAESESYISLQSTGNNLGISFIEGRTLPVKYYSYDRSHSNVLRVYDGTGAAMQEENVDLIYGENFLKLKLNQQLKDEQSYKVEIQDQQGNKHFAFFSISSQN